VWAPARFQKIAETRFSASSDFSSAVIVFLKVGFFGLFAISSISASPAFIAALNAGSKSLSLIFPNSGRSSLPFHLIRWELTLLRNFPGLEADFDMDLLSDGSMRRGICLLNPNLVAGRAANKPSHAWLA